MPVILVLGKLRQDDHEFKASQVHRSSRPIWTTDMGGSGSGKRGRGKGEGEGEESMCALLSSG